MGSVAIGVRSDLHVENGRVDAETLGQLLAPLISQPGRRDDEHAVRRAERPQLRHDQSRLNRLAQAHIVREQHARAEAANHRQRRLELMRQEVDSRQARAPQRAGGRIGGDERPAGASPQTTRTSLEARTTALDALDNVERRQNAAFDPVVRRSKTHERQHLTPLERADVDDPPSPRRTRTTSDCEISITSVGRLAVVACPARMRASRKPVTLSLGQTTSGGQRTCQRDCHRAGRQSREREKRLPTLFVALSSREDGVEEQAERGERLRAMLHGKSEQDDAAHARVHLDDGGTAGDDLLAFEPATEQHILVAVARGRRRVSGRENLVGGAEGKKSSRVRAHPVRERLCRIDLDAKDRAGTEKLSLQSSRVTSRTGNPSALIAKPPA